MSIARVFHSLILVFGVFSAAWASGDPKQSQHAFFDIDPVVVNLAAPDAHRYLQVTFSYEVDGESTLANMKSFLPIIRSRALMVLSTKTVEDVSSLEGKNMLMDQLLDAARFTLSETSPGAQKGIENVHLTSFVIQ
jgi:flagellar protein FliL